MLTEFLDGLEASRIFCHIYSVAEPLWKASAARWIIHTHLAVYHLENIVARVTCSCMDSIEHQILIARLGRHHERNGARIGDLARGTLT